VPAREYLILCGPKTKVPSAWRNWGSQTILLDATPVTGNVNLHIADITIRMVADLPEVAEDMVRLSGYVYSADQACSRGAIDQLDYGRAWRRRFRFVVPVRRPDIWADPRVYEELVRTISFLSDDDFEFRFVPIKGSAGWREFLDYGGRGDTGTVREVDEVMLLSGGMDSLAGAVQEVLVARRRVAMVSHRPVTKLASRQNAIVQALAARGGPSVEPFHVPVVVNKKEDLGQDFTQRTRSFLFVSLAAVVARLFGLDRVRFYENGIVSCNLPVCAQVLGGRASRTTHPQVMNGFQRLIGLLFERPFAVENPFFWKTRTDIVGELRAAGHADLVAHSVSCAHTLPASTDQPHCGTCSQCVDRRLAVLAARLTDAEDPADRYRVDLMAGHLKDVLTQTMVERIVGTAREVESIASPLRFLQRFGEASRLLRQLPGRADDVALELFKMHRRHAVQVNGVLDRELADRVRSGTLGRLPPTCLVRIVSADPTGEAEGRRGAPAEDADKPSPYVPSANDLKVLRALAAAGQTLLGVDLEARAELSHATVSGIVRELTRWKLVRRPHGQRKGVAITDGGRAVVRRADADDASRASA
jgi:7-cyano-7-deazaguanine synthase in queuosine biosynthesis